jgi:hypothetical protein
MGAPTIDRSSALPRHCPSLGGEARGCAPPELPVLTSAVDQSGLQCINLQMPDSAQI